MHGIASPTCCCCDEWVFYLELPGVLQTPSSKLCNNLMARRRSGGVGLCGSMSPLFLFPLSLSFFFFHPGRASKFTSTLSWAVEYWWLFICERGTSRTPLMSRVIKSTLQRHFIGLCATLVEPYWVLLRNSFHSLGAKSQDGSSY